MFACFLELDLVCFLDIFLFDCFFACFLKGVGADGNETELSLSSSRTLNGALLL